MLLNLPFYFYSLLLFIIDIFFHGFFQKKIVHLLLCFYCVYIFKNSTNFNIFFLIFLLTIEGFLTTHCYYVVLLYLIPITLFIVIIRSIIKPYLFLPQSITFTVCLASHYYLLSYFTQSRSVQSYTFYEICGNLLVLLIFLKFLYKGRWDNRF